MSTAFYITAEGLVCVGVRRRFDVNMAISLFSTLLNGKSHAATLNALSQGINVTWAYWLDVPDPADLLGNSISNINDLNEYLKEVVYMSRGHPIYPGQDSTVVDGVAMLPFMLREAAKNMAVVVKEAGEVEEQYKKDMILFFITILLFAIPFVGEAAGVATTLGRVIMLVTVAGDVVTTIYDIVEDPKTAIFAIIGAGSGRYRDAAAERRSMKNAELEADGQKLMCY